MLEEITFTADAKLLELAEEYARRDGTTLEALVREWLATVASGEYFNLRDKPDEKDENRSKSE